MYSLLEHSDNYSMTSESYRNYYWCEVNKDANENSDANNKVNNNETIRKSFEYKTKIIGRIPGDSNTLETEVVASLKYLSYVWRFLDLLLINCEIVLDLSWSNECIISEISKTFRIPANPDANTSVQKVAAIQIKAVQHLSNISNK